MANTLDPMDIKQIITLHRDGLSNRGIGKTLGISRNTVNNYVKLIKAGDRSHEELLALDDTALDRAFPSHTTIDNARYDELMLYFEHVNRARNHPGFTFSYHYHEYSRTAREPYGYTQFMEHYWRRHGKEKARYIGARTSGSQGRTRYGSRI